MAVRKQRLPEPEELFLDFVKRMVRHRDGREILLVHMTRLELINRTRHHIELVTTLLLQIARKYDGRVFAFINGDIACVLRDAPGSELDNLLFEIRYGFSGDEVVKAEDAGEAVFIERFDVDRNYGAVEALAKTRMAAFKVALSASMAAAEDELEHTHSHNQARDPGSLSAPGKVHALAGGAPKKTASLLDMDRGQRDLHAVSGPAPVATVDGPLDAWVQSNSVIAGGADLPLEEILTVVPIYEMGQAVSRAVGATLQISRSNLTDSYGRSVGILMNEKLERFLVEEAETGLISRLGGLASSCLSGASDAEAADVSGGLSFGQSVCLSPAAVLSSTFLVAARSWQQSDESSDNSGRVQFWFDAETAAQDPDQMAYISDFLHEMGHFIGLRGISAGDLESWAVQMSGLDSWALKWPDTDLGRTPRSEIRGLERARDEWGPGHILLQGVNTEDKLQAACAFGFRYTECLDVASVKLFGRSR